MSNYPVRPSHRANLSIDRLEPMCRAAFDTVVRSEGGLTASYGALARLEVRPVGRELSVEPTMNPKVPEDVARETIRRYNQFLEEATGYTSKERSKRLQKAAKAEARGA
ncbi:MAG: DUF5611 family protein [Thermoplasmata archaeon]|nr:DUF5611 family protein [Thermoplasmata archaeon]